ncbi:hypothetical protein GQ55_7G289000 [Panicum hallii var. hallii]|uniref:Uncharacterized protein n=1 Tax=Panicum hallii var. hallii TaxID=1504633 RepID=A0A2T7D060_9POAL|nr:hypothetical protein GQ55_7G289000 [Panicum hallii var. hallii]
MAVRRAMASAAEIDEHNRKRAPFPSSSLVEVRTQVTRPRRRAPPTCRPAKSTPRRSRGFVPCNNPPRLRRRRACVPGSQPPPSAAASPPAQTPSRSQTMITAVLLFAGVPAQHALHLADRATATASTSSIHRQRRVPGEGEPEYVAHRRADLCLLSPETACSPSLTHLRRR